MSWRKWPRYCKKGRRESIKSAQRAMREIIESDWKLLRELKAGALERLCRRILIEVAASCNAAGSSHERFADVFSRVKDGDADVAAIFDDLRRSNAVRRLGLMRAHRLITDAEFGTFTETTRKAASLIADSRIVMMSEAEKS